ncbi:GNAT family N-acetyltransferase [Priestia megaterium]|nr:GNAT family N-acetyltransferase [Priestia megaterium]
MLRKATYTDIQALVRLRLLLLEETGESERDDQALQQATEQYMSTEMRKDRFYAMVIEEAGEIVSVGSVVLFERPPYPSNLLGKEAYILNMYTLPSFRNKGYATKILDKLIKECKHKDVKRIWLHASEAGKNMYRTSGFKEKKSEMEYLF